MTSLHRENLINSSSTTQKPPLPPLESEESKSLTSSQRLSVTHASTVKMEQLKAKEKVKGEKLHVACERCGKNEANKEVIVQRGENETKQKLCLDCVTLLKTEASLVLEATRIEGYHCMLRSKWMFEEMLEFANVGEQFAFFFLFQARDVDFDDVFFIFLIIDYLFSIAKLIKQRHLHIGLHLIVEVGQIAAYIVLLILRKPDLINETNLDAEFLGFCGGFLFLQLVFLILMALAEFKFRNSPPARRGRWKLVLLSLLAKSLVFAIFFGVLNTFSILLVLVASEDSLFSQSWFQFIITVVLFGSGFLMETTIFLLSDSLSRYLKQRKLRKRVSNKSLVNVISKGFAAGRMSQGEYIFRRIKTIIALIIYIGFLIFVFVGAFIELDKGAGQDETLSIILLSLYAFAFVCVGLFIYNLCKSASLRKDARNAASFKVDQADIETDLAILSLFQKYDTNSDNVITRDEFSALATELMGRELSPEELDEALEEVDTDGNGEIDFQEFSDWWKFDVEDNEEKQLAQEILKKGGDVLEKIKIFEQPPASPKGKKPISEAKCCTKCLERDGKQVKAKRVLLMKSGKKIRVCAKCAKDHDPNKEEEAASPKAKSPRSGGNSPRSENSPRKRVSRRHSGRHGGKNKDEKDLVEKVDEKVKEEVAVKGDDAAV